MKTQLALARWPDQTSVFLSHIELYRSKNMFCDCTLACDRKFFRAHKMVLSMSSEFFEGILSSTNDMNPVIILNEVEAWQIESLLNYMYHGETSVPDSHFSSLCRVAKCLQIKGFELVELHRKAAKLSKEFESRQIAHSELSTSNQPFRPNVISSTNNRSHYAFDEDCIRPQSAADEIRGSLKKERFSYQRDPSSDSYSRETYHGSRPNQREPEYNKKYYNVNGTNTPWLKYEDSSPIRNSSGESGLKPPIVLREPPSPPMSHLPMTPPRNESFRKPPQLTILPVINKQPKYFSKSPVNEKPINHLPGLQNTHSSPKPRLEQSPASLREPPPLLKLNSEDDITPKRKFFEDLGLSHSPKRSSKISENWNNHPKPTISSIYKVGSPESDSKSEPTGEPPVIPYNIKRSSSVESPLNLSGRPPSPMENNNDPLLKKIHTNKRKRVRGPKSWEFLLRLLNDPSSNPTLIRWEDEEEGIFRLIQPDVIAQRWGRRTGKQGNDILSYESFARGLRYHYQTKALIAVSEKTYVYQFGPKARLIMSGNKAEENDNNST